MKAIFSRCLFFGLIHFVIGFPQANVATLAVGITTQQIQDAFPERDPLNATNWFGTSLYGWEYIRLHFLVLRTGH